MIYFDKGYTLKIKDKEIISILKDDLISENDNDAEPIKLYRKKKYLITNRGYLEWIVLSLISKGYSISIDGDSDSEIEPLEKWIEILNNPNFGDPHQCEDYLSIIKKVRGLIVCYTGYGKTELELAILESFLKSCKGNALILVPTNPILDEWKLRSEKYNVDFKDRTKIIIPPGILRSNDFDEILPFFKKVEMVITDECHRLTADSWHHIINLLPKVKYSYGFSATPDPERGFIPRASIDEVPLKYMSYPLSRVVGLTSKVIVERKPKHKKVALVSCFGEMMSKKDYVRYFHRHRAKSWKTRGFLIRKNYNKILDGTFRTKKFIWMIDKLSNIYPDRRWYIPVHSKNTGKLIYNELKNKHNRKDIVYWDANVFLSEHGIKSFKDLKEKFEDKCKILISTTVGYEGVDLPSLDAVLLGHGKNVRVTLQPLGRASRSNDILVVLPYDTKNPLMLKHSRERRITIEEEYTIVKRIRYEV